MSTATDTPEQAGEAVTHDAAHHHPSDAEYIKIALILAVITAAEVATYYIPFFEENTTALIIALLPMMVVKFGMVAWFFMHLKQDARLLSRVFVGGIVLALSVYMIVLLAFNEFF